MDYLERFWNRVEPTGFCWNWTGSKNNTGYGNLKVDGKMWTVHRYSYTMLVGEIPEKMVLDHLCRNRACVNPDHLEVVTYLENRLRRIPVEITKPRCPQGHPYSGDNLYRWPGGNSRQCWTCMKKVAKRKRACPVCSKMLTSTAVANHVRTQHSKENNDAS